MSRRTQPASQGSVGRLWEGDSRNRLSRKRLRRLEVMMDIREMERVDI